MQITIELLEDLNACLSSREWLNLNFPNGGDILEVAENCPNYNWISWLIKNCKLAQTQEMIDLYLGKNPDCTDICSLIIYCELAQTQEMIDLYLGKNPDYADISWLIKNCELAQTQEMIDLYLGKNPDYADIRSLIINCEIAKNNKKIIKYYEGLQKC